MSPTKHTPGPWAVNTAGAGDGKGRIVIDEIYVYAPESGVDDVAVAADIADPLTGQPSAANARLIAAAPELLLSVRALIEILETGVMSLGALRAAKALVVKVDGEPV